MIPGEEGEGISHDPWEKGISHDPWEKGISHDPWGGGGYHIRVPMLLSPQIC